MAAAFEFGTEFREVINLAVENDPRAAVFVEDGLMASGKIDDREPAHSETGAVADVEALIVGTAIDDLVAHVAHECFGDIALSSCAHHASNSTHDFSLTPSTLRAKVANLSSNLS